MTVKTLAVACPLGAFDVPEPLLLGAGFDPQAFAGLSDQQQATELQALFPNLPIITWALSHYADLSTLLADFQSLTGSGTFAQKLTALQAIITILEKDMADFPGGSAPSPTPAPSPAPNNPVIGPIPAQLAAVHAEMQAIGDGHIINGIVAFANSPLGQALIQIALAFAKGAV